jgi:HAE1 family hydrophobic/amphiphilic exporter-1
LGNLFGNKFRSYSFGVNIAFPFRNRTAKANLGSALASGRQLDLLQKQTIQNIQIDVRNALQAVESARQRIDAAKSARVNAEAQLTGEEQKFKAGLSQNFLVLQRQNDLSNARGQELRAMTDYNKAVADLQRVLSITLDSAGVSVQSPVTMTDVAPKPDKKDQPKPKP